jgi:hypothetical protein
MEENHCIPASSPVESAGSQPHATPCIIKALAFQLGGLDWARAGAGQLHATLRVAHFLATSPLPTGWKNVLPRAGELQPLFLDRRYDEGVGLQRGEPWVFVTSPRNGEQARYRTPLSYFRTGKTTELHPCLAAGRLLVGELAAQNQHNTSHGAYMQFVRTQPGTSAPTQVYIYDFTTSSELLPSDPSPAPDEFIALGIDSGALRRVGLAPLLPAPTTLVSGGKAGTGAPPPSPPVLRFYTWWSEDAESPELALRVSGNAEAGGGLTRRYAAVAFDLGAQRFTMHLMDCGTGPGASLGGGTTGRLGGLSPFRGGHRAELAIDGLQVHLRGDCGAQLYNLCR